VPQVLNLGHYPQGIPQGAIRIDRQTPWRNPCRIGDPAPVWYSALFEDAPRAGQPMDQEDVIRAFRVWVQEFQDPQAQWIRRHLPHLKGRNLACHCAPRACHGDVLVELANV
jgi:hypothetical protein